MEALKYDLIALSDGIFNTLSEVRGGVAEITRAVLGIRESSIEIESAVKGITDLEHMGRENRLQIADVEAALRKIDLDSHKNTGNT